MTGSGVLRVVSIAAAVVVGIGACGSATPDSTAGDGRTAAVYASVLSWVLDAEGIGDSEEPVEWVLFVASRSEMPIDIDAQVAVVEALEPRIFVRFIDERSEAVDAEGVGVPVREDGLLVGLGAVPPEGETVEVYADRYRNETDSAAWNVTVRRSGDTWAVMGTPTSTEVRPIIAPE